MLIESFSRLLCRFFILFLFSYPVYAEKATVAILAPSVSSELANIFKLIIEGITQSTPQFKKKVFLFSGDNKEDIQRWLLVNQPLAIVTIGEKAHLLAHSIPLNASIVTAGTLLSDDKSAPGVSLSIAESALKKKLRFYLPHIQSIHIGDDGRNIIWFANDGGSPRIIKKAIGNDEKSKVKYLWETINHVDPKKEAVWINNNIDPIFLYKLSERAWERNVTLISNNISHLESGTLLAFYPDFKSMGLRLGDILTLIALGHTLPPLEPLRALSQGINRRTAKHLEIQIPPAIENSFGVVIK